MKNFNYKYLLGLLFVLYSSLLYGQVNFTDFNVCHDKGSLLCVTNKDSRLKFSNGQLKTVTFSDSGFTYDDEKKTVFARLPDSKGKTEEWITIRLQNGEPVLTHNGKSKILKDFDFSNVSKSCDTIGVFNTRSYIDGLELSYIYENCSMKTIDLISGAATLSIIMIRSKKDTDWEIQFRQNDELKSAIAPSAFTLYDDTHEVGISLEKKKEKVREIHFFSFSLPERRITQYLDRKIEYNKTGLVTKNDGELVDKCGCN
jgi:hypothetical protein